MSREVNFQNPYQNRKMKIRIQMALVLAASAAFLGGGCRPEVPQQQFSPEQYTPEQTHGEVRVVLLEVAQLTVFTDKWHSDAQASGVSAAPAFKVTYLVEVPEADGFSSLVLNSTNSLQIAVEGKVVSNEITPGVAQGRSMTATGFGESAVSSYLSRPQIPVGRTALAEETVLRGLRIDADHVDLSISLNWKKKNMLFDFRDVPVN
jgi:hypothetical protein